MRNQYNKKAGDAPTFEDAKTLRQKARSAGVDPDYWYPAEQISSLKAGDVTEVVFMGKSIALFRAHDNSVHAIENRCKHRHLKLSLGEVEGCNVVCPYHGWAYDGDGKVVDIPHEILSNRVPNFGVSSYPCKERYGLFWIFPGDKKKAEHVPMPEIPELENKKPWAHALMDFTIKCHYSMVIDNVSDFTHAYLHRKFKPFIGAKLTRHERLEDKIFVEYDAQIGHGNISGLFVERERLNTDHITLCYDYPYQWSNTGDQIKHWLFVLPIDERTTRSFFIFYFKELKIPFTPFRMPRLVMPSLVSITKHLTIKRILAEDVMALEAEQEGYEKFWCESEIELNPIVRNFQNLAVEKWQNHLSSFDIKETEIKKSDT